MIMSWSDDEEPDGDAESDTAKRVTAMTGRVESESKLVMKIHTMRKSLRLTVTKTSMMQTPPSF